MNTQKIIIGIFAVIGITVFIIWLVKKFGKSGNNSTTPSQTTTPRTTTIMATGGVTPGNINTQRAPINTQRVNPSVPPGNARQNAGVGNH